MLKIIYGDINKCDNFIFDPDSYFNRYRESGWVTDELSKEMILDIDNSIVVSENIIESPVLGSIPPQYLSGGVKTLIMIYNRPDLIFNATWCGENCAKWLLEIGKKKDVIINLEYPMEFPMMETEVKIINTEKIISNAGDLAFESIFLVNKDVNFEGGVFSYER